MAIDVYWGCFEKEWMRAQEPELVSKIFYKKRATAGINKCPAFNNEMTNLFAIKSMYSYSFTTFNDRIESQMYDEDFMNDHVIVRSSFEDKMFSFRQSYIFFTEEKSLNVTGNLLPYLEDNNIMKNCIATPGSFDIGTWLRYIEFGFYLKNDTNTFTVNEGESLSYLKFHTKEKINFKKFLITEKFEEYVKSSSNSHRYSNEIKGNISKYYNNFSIKKNVIKEIKNNLI